MRRWIPAVSFVALVGCGSEHGPEGTLVKAGPGIPGVPGGPAGVSAEHAVPIVPGTLIVTRDGTTAVAADPDRDRVFVVGLATQQVTEVKLEQFDEPGRLAEDGARRVHVATRRGGQLVTIDLASGGIVERRAVCPSPRGVAWDASSDLLHVACETGELVSLPAAGGPATRVLRLGRDLRDVVVSGSKLFVSRLKSAQVHVLAPDGTVESTLRPPDGMSFDGTASEPSVAWRMIGGPAGGVVVAHQRARLSAVTISQPSSYGGGGGCSAGIVEGTVTPLDPSQPSPLPPTMPLGEMVGASDLAVSPDGRFAVVSTGNAWGPANMPIPGEFDRGMPMPAMPVGSTLRVGTLDLLQQPADPCMGSAASNEHVVTGEPTSVAFDGRGRVVVLSREPAQIQVLGQDGLTIPLSTDSRLDSGLALFHMNSGVGLACASCHPEGLEDGRTWEFAELGRRRTQMPAGGVLATAPLHWNGDMKDFTTLVHEVFEARMGAGRPNGNQIEHFARFIDSIALPPAALVDTAAAERGKIVFDAASCSSCHSGSHFTNNGTYDVGTGGEFQVPSLLGVGARSPFLHDGCAPTLLDRFGACGGGDQHGQTSKLSAAEIVDLVAYLETL
jgi:hypothetical protein